jgi:mRNA interferase RelE/StbE
MFRVVYEKKILKSLDKIPTADIERILPIFQELSFNPVPIGSKKLSGKEGFYRIRQGDYRIIYMIDSKEKIIKIVLIAHRKDVYRDF